MAPSPNDEATLKEMKYRDLQKIAKKVGVKANLPKVQMIQMILEAQSSKADDDDGREQPAEDSDTPEGKEADADVWIKKFGKKGPA